MLERDDTSVSTLKLITSNLVRQEQTVFSVGKNKKRHENAINIIGQKFG